MEVFDFNKFVFSNEYKKFLHPIELVFSSKYKKAFFRKKIFEPVVAPFLGRV